MEALGLNFNDDDLSGVLFRISRNKSFRVNFDEFCEEYGNENEVDIKYNLKQAVPLQKTAAANQQNEIGEDSVEFPGFVRYNFRKRNL